MRAIVTGGGTGGHLYPALAIVDALRERNGWEILFVGTRRGIENRILPEEGYPLRHVWMSGIERRRIVKNVLFPAKMVVSFFQAVCILLSYQPDLVLGTGGFVSWPVVSAGIILGKPCVIQEQNRKPGLVTRSLAPFVRQVCLSFEESKHYFRKKDNLVVTGNPTRSRLQLVRKKEAYRHFRLDERRFTLFVFGGSQGARGINRIIEDLLPRLMKNKTMQLIWVTGPRWYGEIREKTAPYADRIRAVSYLHEMEMAYSICDLIICRSGATTIAEIARLGLPVIFIPFPAAAGGHQEANARTLAESGAAAMVLESECDSGRLENVIFDLMESPAKRKAMAGAVKLFGHPQAAGRIVQVIYDQIVLA